LGICDRFSDGGKFITKAFDLVEEGIGDPLAFLVVAEGDAQIRDPDHA
jgi:hypothetical protein